MTKSQAIAATTHVDSHGMKITKEALDKLAEEFQKSETVPALLIEHDTTLPPIGKVIDGKVEKMEDGEYKLVITQEFFDSYSEITLPDGSPAIVQSSQNDNRPFNQREQTELSSNLKISVDRINFNSDEDYTKFTQEINQVEKCEINNFIRKSILPDPEMLITLTTAFLGSSLVTKIGDKLIDKLIDNVIDNTAPKAYQTIKQAIFSMNKYYVPKNTPITYIFLIPGDFEIELIVKTNEPNKVLTAILEENIIKTVEKANEFHKTLDAKKIQFLYNENNEWDFNYLLTNTGSVIGAPESHHKREQRMQLMFQQQDKQEKS